MLAGLSDATQATVAPSQPGGDVDPFLAGNNGESHARQNSADSGLGESRVLFLWRSILCLLSKTVQLGSATAFETVVLTACPVCCRRDGHELQSAAHT